MQQSLRCACLALVLAGCAGKTPPVEKPPPVEMLDDAQRMACAECRLSLQSCERQAQDSIRNPGPPSACMDQFMICLDTQHVDRVRCSSF
jgi:hypothetical protein